MVRRKASPIGATAVLALLLAVASQPAAAVAPKCYSSRYQVKTTGEVFDGSTGLTWQQSPDSGRGPPTRTPT